jgi:ribonucleotide monophosphatase NagD (HAD superfamily)
MLEHHDALIFDCDGVLINSEEIAQEGGHCLDDHAQRLRDSGADLVFAAHVDLATQLALAP